jgi:hypothetical protein
VHGLLIDLDGVLRHRDPAAVDGSERDAGLPAGSIMAAAFEFVEGSRLVGVAPRDCLMGDDSATITAAAAAVGMTVHTFTDAAKLQQWLESVLRHAL